MHSEELRRETNEGLNVVEQWNGATDFAFLAGDTTVGSTPTVVYDLNARVFCRFAWPS